MRFLTLVLAFALLAAWPAAAQLKPPTFGEKTTYAEARAQLIAKGYTPMRNRGQNWNDCEDHPDLCRQFPELAGCIPTAGEMCSFLWKAPDGEFFVLSADGCCEHWVLGPESEFYRPRSVTMSEAEDILSAPDPNLPRLSRKLLYPEVRKRLVELGYRPQAIVAGRSEDACILTYRTMCRRYPEMRECASFCDFFFRRPRDNRWLSVRTYAERGFPFYRVHWASRDEAHGLKFAGGVRPPRE